MIDGFMYPATQPWNHLLDAQIRQMHVVDPERVDTALAVQNREYLFELSDAYGREGDDYQNPNVWQGRGVLVYPSEHSPYLVPSYGHDAADNYADVVLNVNATSHLAIVTT